MLLLLILLCFCFLFFVFQTSLRNKAGFLLLSGIMPRRPVRLLPPGKKKPPRNFSYFEVVLKELRELCETGKT